MFGMPLITICHLIQIFKNQKLDKALAIFGKGKNDNKFPDLADMISHLDKSSKVKNPYYYPRMGSSHIKLTQKVK